jgi:hypothetical protein
MKKLNDVKNEIAELAASIDEKASSQYEYSVKENVHQGILKEEEVADHAFRAGLVSALTQKHDWIISDLLRLCADIMEDADDHDTAAELREKADKEEDDWREVEG